MNKTELRRIIANYEAMTQPEPCRPLTWAELMKVRNVTPLVIEYRYEKTRFKWRLLSINRGQARELERDAGGQKTNYNRTYRFWPRMPTRRERKAAKWEA